MAYSIKATFGEDIRRFSLNEVSFGALLVQLKVLYRFDDQAPLVVRYLDEENDWIRVTSDQELQSAIQFMQGALKITVTTSISPNSIQTPSLPQVQQQPPQGGNIVTVLPTPPDVAQVGRTLCKKELKKLSKDKIKESREYRKGMKHDLKKEKKMHKERQELQRKGELCARFIKDCNKEPLWLSPGAKFTKVWKVRNEGLLPWPVNCTLKFKKGDKLSSQDSITLTRMVLPNEEVELPVDGVAPFESGKYVSIWRLTDPNGIQFGHPLKMKVKVAGSGSSSSSSDSEDNASVEHHMKDPAWSAILSQLAAMGFQNHRLNIRLLRKCKGDVDKVVWKLLKKQRKMAKKAAKMNQNPPTFNHGYFSPQSQQFPGSPSPAYSPAPNSPSMNNNNKNTSMEFCDDKHPMID